MTIWALSDVHLAFGAPSKTMEVFGPVWHDYAARIKQNWERIVQPGDLCYSGRYLLGDELGRCAQGS